MDAIHLMVFLIQISNISTRKIFPRARSHGNGRISLSANMMRPLKMNKEDLENYLYANAPSRKSLQQFISAPLIIVDIKNDKEAAEKLKSQLKFLQIDSGDGKANHSTDGNMGEELKDINEKQDLRVLRHKRQRKRLFTKSYMSSSSHEFNSREKKIFERWMQKRYCNTTATTIPRVTRTREYRGIHPNKYEKLDYKLTKLLNEKRHRPAYNIYNKEPSTDFVRPFQRKLLKTTTPQSVFVFEDLHI